MRPIIIGIGGAHSGAGKTTIASLLLKRLKGWGALKYTKTAIYSSITDDIKILSTEDKDTKIFLDSGADRVLWVQSPVSEIDKLLPMAVERLSDLKGIVVEGNSAIEFLKPDIIIFIFGRDPKRIKESAKGILNIADVIVFDEKPSIEISDSVKGLLKSSDKEKLISYITDMIENKEKIRSLIREKAIDGIVPCTVARKIAKELAVPYKEVGEAADEISIKITDCELGCF